MKERCVVYTYAELAVDISKIAQFWYFEVNKWPLFTLFPGIPLLTDFQILPILAIQKVFWGHFSRS